MSLPDVSPRCLSRMSPSSVSLRWLSQVFLPDVSAGCLSQMFLSHVIPDGCPRCLFQKSLPGISPRYLSQMSHLDVFPWCLLKVFPPDVSPRGLSQVSLPGISSRSLSNVSLVTRDVSCLFQMSILDSQTPTVWGLTLRSYCISFGAQKCGPHVETKHTLLVGLACDVGGSAESTWLLGRFAWLAD